MDWKTLLAYITGTVDHELLVRNESLVTENRILRQQIEGRIPLSEGERKTLAETGKRPGRKALAEVASLVKPDSILAWHSALVAYSGFHSDVWHICPESACPPGKIWTAPLRLVANRSRSLMAPSSARSRGVPSLARIWRL
jgi:hypothetical protein